MHLLSETCLRVYQFPHSLKDLLLLRVLGQRLGVVGRNASFRMINYFSGERSGRLIKCFGALEWPPRSPDFGQFSKRL